MSLGWLCTHACWCLTILGAPSIDVLTGWLKYYTQTQTRAVFAAAELPVICSVTVQEALA